jgi:glycosyltransferase involved in cell wall biosynthesis
MERPVEPIDGWLLYITNHFTHPVREAQGASPRYHLARAISSTGQRVIVYCPLGRHVGNALKDFVVNLWPKRVIEGDATYLFPPVVVSPSSATTVLTLILGTLFIVAYLSLTRIKIVAQYSTTVLVASVGAVVRELLGVPLVVNYGDPDFAREKGAARRAFGFCEDLVLARRNAYAVVFVDEVIGRYVRERYGVKRTHFLPNGGHEKGSVPFEPDSPETLALKERLRIGGKRVVIYAGQISPIYRLDVLVDAAKMIRQDFPDMVFLVVGDGPGLLSLRSSVRQGHLDENFRIVGAVPYAKIGPHLAAAEVGLQLLSDMCMGTKVLMYMSQGLPVISTGSWYGQYHEFLRNGENVILIPPASEPLREQVIRLLKDSRLKREIGEAGWRAALPYTWERHADDTLNLLREAILAQSKPKTTRQDSKKLNSGHPT